jgi:hypothetical protein
MNYDANKYRALGVGETVREGDYYTYPGDTIPPELCRSSIGTIINAEDDAVFLRPIEIDTPKDIFPSGAARSAAEGRGRFDLIPYEAMLSLAKRYEMGAKIFGENNWLKGQPLSRLLSSMRRHAHQINYDFGEDHVGAVLWNAAAFVTMVARVEAGLVPREIDDIGFFANREAQKQ